MITTRDPWDGEEGHFGGNVFEDCTELFRSHPKLLGPDGGPLMVKVERQPIGFDLRQKSVREAMK